MAQVDNHRWNADPNLFAAALKVDDAPGFFKKSLVIEPGTRGLIVDGGRYLGEVGAGTYTLESFTERLSFWRRKQATIVLTRQEDTILDIEYPGVPTAENISVDVFLRVAVQIEDVGLFLRNLIGTRDVFTVDELRDTLAPIVGQALWEAIGILSIKDATGPKCREEVDAAVAEALGLGMRRYGLKFVRVQVTNVRHEAFDAHREQQGAVWLEQQENDLAATADQINIDRQESELAAELRRIGVRKQLRAAIQSEEFDKISSEEELKAFLHERDKQRLLRAEEKENLVVAYQQRKAEGELTRPHLLSKLQLEQQMELEQVREHLDYEMRIKRLDHEMEIARRTQSQQNAEWLQSLEKERRESDHRRRERDAELKQQREWNRAESENRRDQEWAELLHKQKLDGVQSELQIAQAERRTRIARIEHELKQHLDNEAFEAEKRRRDWEIEIGSRENLEQHERLKQVQELNKDAERHQLDLEERRKRLDAELETTRTQSEKQHELDLIKAKSQLSADALIATSETANAALLADLKKHEASAQYEKAKAESEKQNILLAAQADAQSQLTKAEKEKSDAITAAYREMIEAQKTAHQQALDAVRDTSKPATPIVVGPGLQNVTPAGPDGQHGGSPPPTAQKKVVVCPSCRAENPEHSRHCSACGTQI